MNFQKPRNQFNGDQKWVAACSAPVSLNTPVRYSSSNGRTDGNINKENRQKSAAGTNNSLLEVEKMRLELKKVVAGDNFLEGVMGALHEKEVNGSVELQESKNIKGGPPIFEIRKISRRLSAGDLGNVIKTPGLSASSNIGSKFLFKYGQGSGNKFRVLDPIEFGAHSETSGAISFGQSVSVLRARLEEQEFEETEEEVVETALKLKNDIQNSKQNKGLKDGPENLDFELQKEEGDWNSNQLEFEGLLKDLNETDLRSDDAMDVLDELEKSEVSSDEDCSSQEDVENKELLEENIFSLEDFFSIDSAGMGNGEKEINEISLKNCEVAVTNSSNATSQNKSNGDPIKHYRRRRLGSVKQHTHQLQNQSGGNYQVGKLGKFLAPLKLGLVPLKGYSRRRAQKSGIKEDDKRMEKSKTLQAEPIFPIFETAVVSAGGELTV